ncbi:MAG: nitrogen regulation protein NR(II) [Gemmatimonadota bacterium]
MERIASALSARPSRRPLEPGRVLYWIYSARLAVALGVYGAAIFVGDVWQSGPGGALEPGVRTLSILALAAAGAFTPLSYWYSHRRSEAPGRSFLYSQVVLDVLLVTGIVHITGGSESVFAPLLYVALVSGYALLLPLSSAVLVALATGIAYAGEVALRSPYFLSATVLAQIAVFASVATASALIGGRLRQVGQALSRMEGELKRLELGTWDILQNIGSGVLALDDSGRVVYMNRAAERLLGLEAEAWVGRGMLGELAERAPGVAEAIDRTVRRGRPLGSLDVEIVHEAGGEKRPATVQTGLLERPAAPPLVTVVLQDARMARQLNELHRRTSRLEAVAELSASLAHELKNPLASIRSAVEQLADPGAPEEDRATLSRLIVRETDRLSRLLGEFNDFARVDVLARKPIELDRMVAEAVEVVRQRPEAVDRATFTVRMEEPLDDLWGDPDLIHRTLVNLLLNAIQVGEIGRKVHVEIVVDALQPDVVPREISAGLPVRIRVTDDGPGISPEDMERIFDPFFTRRKGGSGMGLAIAHRAIEAHGGALLVSSEPGRGATFVIVLPRRESERRQPELLAGRGQPGPRRQADMT